MYMDCYYLIMNKTYLKSTYNPGKFHWKKTQQPKMQGPFYGKKIHFRKNWLIFWGIWGETEWFLWIWQVRENTFRELRNFLSGIWGDQLNALFSGIKGAQTPSPGASATTAYLCFVPMRQKCSLVRCNKFLNKAFASLPRKKEIGNRVG